MKSVDRVTFKVNGEPCSVSSEVDSDTTVLEYVRDTLNFHGTKFMCKEGGCGSCIVNATMPDLYTGGRRTMAINSCLVSITSCQDWEIKTIEGLGDRRTGYHPVQRALAEHSGTQCGYCSPGWVMSMYSLLESNHYDLTQLQIENSFGSNICRCTGYRPILDAFKTFAKDAPKPDNLADIEDLKICNKSCDKSCDGKDWCLVNKVDARSNEMKKIILKDKRTFYIVHELKQIFEILKKEGDDYILIGGNTGKGAYPIFAYPRVLIDISRVLELKTHVVDQNLVLGAATTLNDTISIFYEVSRQREEFSYLALLADHITLVAHIPVRNIGTIAGNLMVKHRVPVFSSDLFLLLETIGAVLVIVDKHGTVYVVTPADFLHLDMTGKLITEIRIPPYSQNYRFVSFKIMPRGASAHAQVNAAFLYEFARDGETVRSARIVVGGISAAFVHASHTEEYVVGKKIFTDEVLQGALKVLEQELKAEEIAGELKPEYRKKCALGLFYKSLLVLIPESRLNPRYRSGSRRLRRTRPLSKGSQEYDTNPLIWPITEPSPKVEALTQCAGEVKYVNDLPSQPREVFCAFVTSDICTGELLDIDPTPALKLPGVIAFFSAKDIPGPNCFLPPQVPILLSSEQIFCDSQIKYYDQPIGVIVAETDKLANRAALLVHVKYKKDTRKPVLTIAEAVKDPNRISLFSAIPARNAGGNVQRVIKDYNRILHQYHFSMETLHSVTRPSDDGLDAFISTQWADAVQSAISYALDIQSNRVNLVIPRNGGAYGVKLTRPGWNATVCALATYLTNRPCRFTMSIQAMLRVIGKRPPATVEFEVGVDDRGEIQYLDYNLYEDLGYVYSDQFVILISSGIKNCYENSRWSMKIYDVLTDTATSTWMRSPGNFEAITHTEMIMEEISYVIDKDPAEVRRANINPQYPEVTEMLDELLQDREYYRRKKEVDEFNSRNRWKKRGIRISAMSWGASINSGFQVDINVLHIDGTVVVKHGAIEIGQGVNTKLIQVVAYTLNISTDMVKVKSSDSATANSFLAGTSRASSSVYIGAIKCCQVLLDRLSATRETLNNPSWALLVQTAFLAGINLQTSYYTTSNDTVNYRVGGVAMAEVELDIITGEHEIRRVDIIEDAGTPINPEIDIGQIEGAFVMGMGYWTSEHIIYDENTGEISQTGRGSTMCQVGLIYLLILGSN
ncbi:indole-3-acetaldehyde oxidase-like [Leguminivora glycinivorella]|uniref:indole-3-acetaldehyde oxidase-like n=1 Tax=Leguminivora glycinivorella TaxID=1035111 RepID=UPI00200F1EB4|nr:indole-3-acetaldehyde oxidase-like [Leguminivora glycinivorella]